MRLMASLDRIAGFIRFGVTTIVAAISSGCTDVQQYTSKDLTILPCERMAYEFFLPLEFDAEGKFVYPDQVAVIEGALHSIEHIYVFVHGWDKTTKTAERDYQELICRFYTHSKNSPSSREGAIIIGVFWPSEEFPRWVNFLGE